MNLTEPFDLVSPPDSDSQALRDQLAAYALSADLITPGEKLVVPAEEWGAICRETLDLVTGLLLLRRALIALMLSDHVEALALPFTELAAASLVPLRVACDPAKLPNLLQLTLPGGGLVTVSSSAYNEPPPSFDSEDEREVDRLRRALTVMLDAMDNGMGVENAKSLARVTLRR